MLREKLIKKNLKGEDELLAYYIRGEADSPTKVRVIIGGGPMGLGGKVVEFGPGETLRFETVKDE